MTAREPRRELRRFYVAGGTLDPESPSYLVREADKLLYEQVREGEFCNVLNSRQVGKSSLMTRIARRLEAAGVATATVDLSTIGGKDADPWYYGVLHEILDELMISVDLARWWEQLAHQSPVHRFSAAFRDLVLAETEKPIVIFVDEIDKTLELSFTDDFFGAIRGFYNARSRIPAYHRLTFVLLGVASPGELVKDARNTPFNIGVPVELQDFTLDQARPLMAGLGIASGSAETALANVLWWTSGHPYLTQKLFKALARKVTQDFSKESVEELVQEIFLTPGRRRQEHNFDDVRRRLCSDPPELRRKQLELYSRALQRQPLRDEPQSLPISRLKLTGLVKADDNGILQVRNRIYRRVFDAAWVDKLMPRRSRENLTWAFPVLVSVAAVLWLSIASYQVWKIRHASDEVPLSHYRTLENLGLRSKAGAELAAYYDRLADRARTEGNPATELLQRLRALTYQNDEDRRYQAFLVEQSFKNLEATAELPRGLRVLAIGEGGGWWVTTDEHSLGELWHRRSRQALGDLGPVTTAIFLQEAGATQASVLLTGSGEGSLSLWHLDRETPVRVWSRAAHTGPITALAGSRDGRWLATGSQDKRVMLWRLERNGKEPEQLPALPFSNSVEHVAVSSDGRWVASRVVQEAETLWLWRLDRQPPEISELKHEARVSSFAFSHDDRHLLVGTDAHPSAALLAWELAAKGVAAKPKELQQQTSAVTALITAPGKVGTGHDDGTVIIWDTESTTPADPRQPRIVLEESYVLSGQRTPIDLLALPTNARRIVAGSRRGRISFWTLDAPSAQRLETSAPVSELVFSPDLSRLAIGNSDGVVDLWELARAEPRSFQLGASVSSLAFHPAGRWLAAGSTSGYVHIQPLSSEDAGTEPFKAYVSSASVNALCFSPTRDVLAVGSRDGRVSLWEIGDQANFLQSLTPQGKEIKALDVSPGGRWLKAERIDGTAGLWDLTTGHAHAPLPAPPRQLTFSAFGPEDRWLATASVEVGTEPGFSLRPRLAVWDLETDPDTGPASQVLVDEPIQWISFAVDGRRLMTTDVEGFLRHWFWQGNELSDEHRGDRYDLSQALWPQNVQAAEFDPQDPRLIVYRDQWVHTFSSLDGGVTWRESSFPYAIRWFKEHYRLAGDTVRLAEVTEGAVLVETIEILQKVREEPTSSLRDWQEKLALILRPEAAEPAPWPRNW